MKILIACEYSGIVRDAFIQKGHDVISCDLLPTESPGAHYQGDIFDIINNGFDMMLAFPPCTHLAVSGAKHFEYKKSQGLLFSDKNEQQQAIEFFLNLANSNIDKIAIENPIGIMSSKFRKPNQIVQPFEYGHQVSKSTCLWLKNLPLLKSTKFVEPEGYLYCCGNIVHDDLGKYGCPNCNGDKVAKRRYKNQTPVGADNRGPYPDRWKDRSRTYTGIATAMAEQWG